ncbi:MAG TPA: amidohydrolase family protein [Micromonosporaceae bacterium]|nr:amidohydrolase family protein [Micromonosporaceae bacterium]
MKVVDADAHVAARSDEGVELINTALTTWPDLFRRRTDGVPGIMIEGRPYPQVEGPGAGCPPGHGLLKVDGIDPLHLDGVLADASRDGIEDMVLFPGLGHFALSIEDRSASVGLARLYNEWLAAFCARSGGRLHGVGVLPVDFPDDAVAVVVQARELGLVAGLVPPAPRTGNLDSSRFDPVYRAAVKADLPLVVHGGPGIHLAKVGYDRFTNYVQVHSVSFPFEQMLAMTSLVSGGVFERHPQLRVALMEAGVGWVPYFVERLTEHYELRGSWVPDGWQRPPVEYLRRGNLFVSCEPEESLLPAVVEHLGADFIMFASDYPHWDSAWPNSTKQLRTRTDLSDLDREKILAGNARRFYRL